MPYCTARDQVQEHSNGVIATSVDIYSLVYFVRYSPWNCPVAFEVRGNACISEVIPTMGFVYATVNSKHVAAYVSERTEVSIGQKYAVHRTDGQEWIISYS